MTRIPSTSIDLRATKGVIRRRTALVAAGAAVCALAGTVAGGLGSPGSSDAAAVNSTPGLPSGFPSGTPSIPGLPSIGGILLSSLTSGHQSSGSGSAQFDSTGAVSSPTLPGGLPATGLPSAGSLPGVGSSGLPPLPATGLPIPPLGSGLPSVPGLPTGLPAGLPAIPACLRSPLGGLGGSGGAANCVTTPPLPASPLGSLPVNGSGTGSATSPLGGVTIAVSTSGATVCAG